MPSQKASDSTFQLAHAMAPLLHTFSTLFATLLFTLIATLVTHYPHTLHLTLLTHYLLL